MEGYVNSVRKCGATPFIIPYGTTENIDDYIDSFDSFIFSGGQDVTPYLYGQEIANVTRTPQIDRDLFEIELIKKAISNDKAILGICRGSQLINVALGGTLYQDLSLYGASVTHEQPEDINNAIPTHRIQIDPKSIFYQYLGESCEVNSIHHQGIDLLAEKLKPSAISEDCVIEAFESKLQDKRIFGVQWHPEMMARKNPDMNKLFELVL